VCSLFVLINIRLFVIFAIELFYKGGGGWRLYLIVCVLPSLDTVPTLLDKEDEEITEIKANG
jgi:hypothetical protein